MSKTGLTEKKILRLERSLRKIYRLKNEILNLAGESVYQAALKNKIAELLLILGEITDHANPKNQQLDSFIRESNLRFVGMEIENSPWPAIQHEAELFCEHINSMAFHFTRKGVKILAKKTRRT